MDKGKWIKTEDLWPCVGVTRLWQTASALMFVGYLSEDGRLVYLSDDDTRYIHANDCVAHKRLPNPSRVDIKEADALNNADAPSRQVAVLTEAIDNAVNQLDRKIFSDTSRGGIGGQMLTVESLEEYERRVEQIQRELNAAVLKSQRIQEGESD